MIRLNKLAIEGFRSFGEDQVFTFPNDDYGFYSITGENQVEPDLGANGTGKSSIGEAIVWVLTGKTSRGLKGKDISNRYGEYIPSVCLEFYLDGQLYGLTRTWNPITLVLDKLGDKPKVITQEELEQLLNGSHFEIIRTILFGQFQQFFFDESGSEKISILSQILRVAVWDNAVDTSKDIIKSKDIQISDLSTEVYKIMGELERIEFDRLKLMDQSMTFEAEKGNSKHYLETELRASQEELDIVLDTLSKSEKSIKSLKDKSSKRQTRMDVTAASKRKAQEIKAELDKAISILKDRINQARLKHNRLASIEGPCPLCLQNLGAKHKASVEDDYKKEHEELNNALEELYIQYEGADLKYNELDITEKDIYKEIKVYLDSIEDTTKILNKCKVKEAVLKEAILRIKKDLSELNLAKNIYKDDLEKLLVIIKDKKEKLSYKQANLDVYKTEKAKAEFWVKKFKEVRLWVIEQALTEFELHVNNALEELGLLGYKIKMDIEKPKSDKSGYIKGFHIFITTKDSPESIPWEAWSGGESQRLRLAGTIGLADLISSRTGFYCNTEIWDEPTTHLSQEGIDDLLQVLSNRARIRGKQIWLVDHRSLNAGDFDGSVHIVKDQYGSHIKQPQPKTEVVKIKKKISKPVL